MLDWQPCAKDKKYVFAFDDKVCTFKVTLCNFCTTSITKLNSNIMAASERIIALSGNDFSSYLDYFLLSFNNFCYICYSSHGLTQSSIVQ